MELLEGLDCDLLVRRFGALPPARVVHLMTQVCESLEEAHEKGADPPRCEAREHLRLLRRVLADARAASVRGLRLPRGHLEAPPREQFVLGHAITTEAWQRQIDTAQRPRTEVWSHWLVQVAEKAESRFGRIGLAP